MLFNSYVFMLAFLPVTLIVYFLLGRLPAELMIASYDQVRRDAGQLGETRLYLLTDHTDFYARCGWDYLCTIQGEDGDSSRVYTAEAL